MQKSEKKDRGRESQREEEREKCSREMQPIEEHSLLEIMTGSCVLQKKTHLPELVGYRDTDTSKTDTCMRAVSLLCLSLLSVIRPWYSAANEMIWSEYTRLLILV